MEKAAREHAAQEQDTEHDDYNEKTGVSRKRRRVAHVPGSCRLVIRNASSSVGAERSRR
jgi:hypothetical protein